MTTLCLGTFSKRTATYLRGMCNESPSCNAYLVFRGRGSRKENGNNQTLPVKYAEKVAVYIRPKKRKTKGEIIWQKQT